MNGVAEVASSTQAFNDQLSYNKNHLFQKLTGVAFPKLKCRNTTSRFLVLSKECNAMNQSVQ